MSETEPGCEVIGERIERAQPHRLPVRFDSQDRLVLRGIASNRPGSDPEAVADSGLAGDAGRSPQKCRNQSVAVWQRLSEGAPWEECFMGA